MSFSKKIIPLFILLGSCQLYNPLSKTFNEGMYPSKNLEIKYHVEWQTNFYNKRIVDFKKKPIGFKKVVFLGNSITQGAGSWNKRFDLRNLVNRGISGDNTEGVLSRLNEIHYYEPVGVFLLIGINDIFNSDSTNWEDITPQYVSNNIIKIAKQLHNNSVHTKIYIQTILPVDLKKYSEPNGKELLHGLDLNEQIKEINSILLKRAHLISNVEIIDLYTLFLDERGLLDSNLSSDGIHLNDLGYDLWVEILEPHVNDLNSLLYNKK